MSQTPGPELFPADPLGSIRHRVAACGPSAVPACADRALLLAAYDARQERVRQVLEGLLDPVPSLDSPADLDWHRIRFHNERIFAAAATLGIDLTT